MDDADLTLVTTTQTMSVRELTQDLEAVNKLRDRHSNELARLEQQFAALQQAYQSLSRHAQSLQTSMQQQ